MSLNKNHIIAVLALFLLVGVFMLLSPVKANAGTNGLGCCINNSPSGNCVQCGTEDDSCQTEQVGACPDIIEDPSLCGGEGGERGCFVPGAVCFQDDVNTGICGEPPAEPECEEDADCQEGEGGFDADICTDDFCSEAGVCASVFDGTNDPELCVPPTPVAAVVPTLSQWGIIIATIVIGFFAVMMLWKKRDSEI